jgi:integrase
MSGQSGSGSNSSTERATLPCSISPSIASSEAAISCGYKLTTFAPAAGSETAPRSFRRRPAGPVQFEITEQTRAAIRAWLPEVEARNGRHLFPSRFRAQPHLSTRQYARIVHAWVESAGLDSSAYGTHSMRRTKAAQIYKKTGNLRAVQLLLGHTKLESTVRYLGIEVDDALSISEQVEL